MNRLILMLLTFLVLTHYLTYSIIESSMLINYLLFILLVLIGIKFSKNLKIKIWLIYYFLFLLFISLFSVSIVLSTLYVVLIFGFFFIFKLFVNNENSFFRISLYTGLFVIIISIIYSLLDPSTIGFRGGNLAVRGIFKNNNSFAQIILFTLLSCYLIRKKNNSLFIISIFLFLSFFTSSRSVIISILILLIIEILKIKRQYLIISMSILMGLLLFMREKLLLLIEKTFRTTSLSVNDLSESRLQLYLQFKSIMFKIPFTGFGIGNQTEIWKYGNITGGNGIEGLGLHNTFLQVFAEQGMLGFIIFIFINLVALYKLFNTNRKMFIVLLVILISAFFESNIYYITSPLSYIYWFIIFYSINERMSIDENLTLAKCD